MVEWSTVIAIFGFLGVVYGLYTNYKNNHRNDKNEAKKEAEVDTTMQLDIQYIKRSMDDVLLEQKDTNRRLEGVNNEITKIKVDFAEWKNRVKVLENTHFKNKADGSNG